MKFRLAPLCVICFLVFVEMFYPRLGTYSMNSFTSSNNPVRQDQSSSRQYEYRFLESAKGITNEGLEASFRTYESSDGVRVFTRTEFFRSVSEMETWFEKKANSFSEIIQRSSIKDDNGNVIGERILGKTLPDEQGKVMHSIIWNHGIEISYIESTSLDHILDFERKFYKAQR